MSGTAAEVTPLRSVDDHELGVGPVTRAIQQAYLDTVRGHSERWAQWLDPVPQIVHEERGEHGHSKSERHRWRRSRRLAISRA